MGLERRRSNFLVQGVDGSMRRSGRSPRNLCKCLIVHSGRLCLWPHVACLFPSCIKMLSSGFLVRGRRFSFPGLIRNESQCLKLVLINVAVQVEEVPSPVHDSFPSWP